jgi:hypothetical protein
MLQIANAFFKLYALPVVCALLNLTYPQVLVTT